jgi:uncharacterized protein YjeT (DUF2065 family)
MTLTVYRVVHIAAAAALFGGLLGWGSMLKRGLIGGQRAFTATASIVKSRLTLVRLAGLVALVTGFLIIFERGGLSSVSPSIYAGLGLLIVLLGLVDGVASKPIKRMVELSRGSTWNDAVIQEAAAGAKKVGLVTGICHTLWFVILVLMRV